MDLFKEFELKFKSIDAKIISCRESIKKASCTQMAKISLDNLEAQYRNGLNESRELILEQAKEARDKQIEEINEFTERSRSTRVCFDSLIEGIKSVSSNNLAFSKSIVSINESILFRTGLEKNLSFSKLAKYSHFFPATTVYMLEISKYFDIQSYDRLNKISADLYCICGQAKTEINKYHVIMFNKEGRVIRSKTLKRISSDIRVNKTHIICFIKYDSKVEIYNFSLELVASFEFDGQQFPDYGVNNYELGFFNRKESVFRCFDYQYAAIRLVEHKLDKAMFAASNCSDFKLVDFNDAFLFLSYESKEEHAKTLFLVDRDNYRLVFKYGEGLDICFWFIEDTEIAGNVFNERKGAIFSSNKQDRESVERVELNEGNFFDFYLISRHKFLSEVPLNKLFIKFNEY